MERPITKLTPYTDYDGKYLGEYVDYFQIHIYSVPEIISTYYHPQNASIESVTHAAEVLLKNIKQRSPQSDGITLFKKNGKFLITETADVFDSGQLHFFDAERVAYDNLYEKEEIDHYIDETHVDDFIKNSLITIGAGDLYELVEPFALNKRKQMDSWKESNEKLRELNKTDPHFILEFYNIDKDYKPVLFKTVQVHSEEALYLPEYMKLHFRKERISYLLKDMKTLKVVDGNLEEAIEAIKFRKWQKRNPSVMDLEDIQRMELDDDDPDFLSYDDYIKSDEPLEEGDEEYSPDF